MSAHLDPSAAPPDELSRMSEFAPTTSILIDAIRKWAYPPTSLPKKEFMEQAKKIWEEKGLPPPSPKVPWYGSSFGYWPAEYQEEAELALKGEHHKTGEKLARERRKV